MVWSEEKVEIVERCRGRAGELQLQRRGNEFEIIYNGTFLMATYNGASEKAAIRDALDLVSTRHFGSLNILMGGLGVGYSLQEALAFESVTLVKVVEIEPAVIRWNRSLLRHLNRDALDDCRSVVINSDFRELLEAEAEKALAMHDCRYHVVMVDTDNGSSWLSLSSNAFFYSTAGLQLIDTCLHPGGVACFWCSRREKPFEDRLREIFAQVSFYSVTEKTGQEGCYYLAEKSQ